MFVQIKGFDNYMINEDGDILNLSTNKIMKFYITNKGYKAIDLWKNGKKYKFLIHRLVAMHFVSNPNNYPIVLHKNNIKLDTNYLNLKWGTYSQNNSQAIRDGINTIPKPDNRIYYRIFDKNNNMIDIIYGIHNLKNKLEYKKSIHGLYSIIHRGSILKDGPYKGCHIEQAKDLINAIYFT